MKNIKRNKVYSINYIDYKDEKVMSSIATIVSDVEGILDFKEKAPSIAKEFCISYREYEYGSEYMLLFHKSILNLILSKTFDVSEIAKDPNLIHLPKPRFYTTEDAINNYVNVKREDECQFYTLDQWDYNKQIGFYLNLQYPNYGEECMELEG